MRLSIVAACGWLSAIILTVSLHYCIDARCRGRCGGIADAPTVNSSPLKHDTQKNLWTTHTPLASQHQLLAWNSLATRTWCCVDSQPANQSNCDICGVTNQLNPKTPGEETPSFLYALLQGERLPFCLPLSCACLSDVI